MIDTLTQSLANPVWNFLTCECRPSELTAFLDAVKEAREPDDQHDAARVVFIQAALDVISPNLGEEVALGEKSGFNGWYPLGMQWLVIGMAPGIEFLCALDTRAQAVAWLADDYEGRTFDYYAIVKARDFYRLP